MGAVAPIDEDPVSGTAVSSQAHTLEESSASPFPSVLVTEGETDALRFVGLRKFGLCFMLRAHGRVAGEPDWGFHFVEHALLSRHGVSNWGIMTVDTPDGTFVVRFQGRMHGVRWLVCGQCWAEGINGRYAGAKQSGVYEGVARLVFDVTYKFHCAAQGQASASA